MKTLEKNLNFALLLCLSASSSFALYQGDDQFRSPAVRAMSFQKTAAFWVDQRFGIFDGLISNDQTESKRFDRRLAYGLGAGFERPLIANLSLRLDGRGESVKRRQLDNAAPETSLNESYVTFRPSAALTYVTPAGLEIYGGAVWNVLPGYTQTIRSSTDKATVKFQTVQFMAPQLGVTRRGGFGVGGLYYQFGREQSRSVTKFASDGTKLEMSETKQEPTTLGVYAQVPGMGALWAIEGAAVSEGEGGERTESGSPIRDDHLELGIKSLWPAGISFGLRHHTARYAKSAYMDLDSIPISSVQVLWATTGQGMNIHFGGIGAMGRDKQSIPEINARYEVNAFSFLGGLYASL
ncbi:MAG: hypothetical protein NTV34_20300 [Proteobacteria bacterium]|nr:hypothetical protein [Pseudomonadota bacterium]